MPDKTYSFSTFQELIERVPADRIEDCFREMGALFAMTKSAATLGGENVLEVQLPITWLDDGKGDLKSTLHGDGPSIILQTSLTGDLKSTLHTP